MKNDPGAAQLGVVPAQPAPSQAQPPFDPVVHARRFVLEVANMNNGIAGRLLVETDPGKLLDELIRQAKFIQTKGL